MHRLALALLIPCYACVPIDAAPPEPTDSLDPNDSDTEESDPDTPADTDEDPPLAATWTVRIEPATPAFDDDLRCVSDDATPGDVATVRWRANGVEAGTGAPYEMTPQTQHLPGDLVPHRKQAGGQVWTCALVAVDGSMAVSAAVTVEPILPMVKIEPGSFWFHPLASQGVGPSTLTREFLIGSHEVTQEQWLAFAGSLNYAEDGANLPVGWISWHDAMWFTNLLSVADGLPECYTCSAPSPLAACELPADPYVCEGYRLPMWAEWEFAGSARGQHQDPLPAGGMPFPYDEWPDDAYPMNPPVVGMYAPPDTTVGSQCWFSGVRPRGKSSEAVGQLLPNSLGLYDICGNREEYINDRSEDFSQIDLVNPIGLGTVAFRLGGSMGSGSNQVGLFRRTGVSHQPGSEGSSSATVRIVRTNFPVMLP